MNAHALALPVALLVLASGTPPARAAEDNPELGPRLVRFDFENDFFVGSDDAFTGGWSLHYHTAAHDVWPDAFSRKVISWVPGLGDDGVGGRVVRRSIGVSQQMITPEDLRVAEFRPDDVPWAGRAGVHGSWMSLDNRRMAALQVYVGCLGPCSHAEEVQRFIHEDLDKGPDPLGWRNQLEDKFLVNLNYALRWKVFRDDETAYNAPQWANDLSVGTQGAVGNLSTLINAFVEWRIGWSLPLGFTAMADPVGMEVAVDPWIPPAASTKTTRWHMYFSAAGRVTHLFDHDIVDGGMTDNGYYHPGADFSNPQYQFVTGVHLTRDQFGLHAVYHDYLGSRADLPNGSKPDWMGISLDYRF